MMADRSEPTERAVRYYTSLYWHMDVRRGFSVEEAREHLRSEGLWDHVRDFLKDAMIGRGITASEWEDLTNLAIDDPEEVGWDARDFWEWLFEDEPPADHNPAERAPLRPPQI